MFGKGCIIYLPTNNKKAPAPKSATNTFECIKVNRVPGHNRITYNQSTFYLNRYSAGFAIGNFSKVLRYSELFLVFWLKGGIKP